MASETNINMQYKDRLFKLVFRDKKDLLQLYNAVNHTSYHNPEDMDAAVDCRATVLNINVGHNQELMKQCRKLEEYSIFIGKVRSYQKTTKDIKGAINLAVDDCIENGVLADILRDNREEVCAMLLREYNEQAHIDSEKQISMEEGEKRIERLIILLTEQGRAEDIIKFAKDDEYKKKLLEEFNL